MTHDEYRQAMDEKSDWLKYATGDEWERRYEEISNFQADYMNSVIEEYKQKADTDAKMAVVNILHYVVSATTSGNVIWEFDTEAEAREVSELLWDDFSDFMLEDSPQVYKNDGEWVVDCMFGGYYVPFWDGWYEGDY